MARPDNTLPLFPVGEEPNTAEHKSLEEELEAFDQFGKPTVVFEKEYAEDAGISIYVNEFWTSKQRAAHVIHEISYRACFKPQLPAFFIDRLTKPGDLVYDPFMGRGTTPLEAALRGRSVAGCDINPLSKILLEGRLHPPSQHEIEKRLHEIDLDKQVRTRDDLLVFYHPDTLRQITNLRRFFLKRSETGKTDAVDDWIRAIATNRLTGHSPGFFSVYTMPPNQAVSIETQKTINERRKQTPPRRDVRAVIGKKSRLMLRRVSEIDRERLRTAGGTAILQTRACDNTPEVPNGSVKLVVTSPPFLDVVNYERDNWLRCWFNGIDPAEVGIWQMGKPEIWQEKMTSVLRELHRVLADDGHVAFEVGEVRRGTLDLVDLVVPAGVDAGLTPRLVMINDQKFTKTANCWGVDNHSKGTNTNRIVLFRK